MWILKTKPTIRKTKPMTMMARRWVVAAKTQVLLFGIVIANFAWGAAQPVQSEFPTPKALEPNVAFVKRDDKFRRMDFVRAQNGLKNRFEKGYFLSGAHEKEIRLRLKEAGLPEDLIAVVFVESLFYSRATSHAGAGGIWQFMKGTARE